MRESKLSKRPRRRYARALRALRSNGEVAVSGLSVICGDVVAAECPSTEVRDLVAAFLSNPAEWP